MRDVAIREGRLDFGSAIRGARQLVFLRRLVRRRLALPALIIIVLVSFAAITAGSFAPYEPAALDVKHQLEAPSLTHLFGTDQLGRDLFSRMMYGSRVSLGVGVGSAVLGILLGVPIGLVAGYRGGIVDTLASRLMDCVLAFPAVMLAIAIVAFLGQSLSSLIIAIGVASAPWFGRLVRSEALSLREQDFVHAAMASGATDVRILRTHILPNLTAPIIVQSSLTAGQAIIAEASLSFLGIGVRPPTPTWGGDLQFGFGWLDLHPYLWMIPSLCIFLLTMSFNVLGDALRDVLDPRLRGQSS